MDLLGQLSMTALAQALQLRFQASRMAQLIPSGFRLSTL